MATSLSFRGFPAVSPPDRRHLGAGLAFTCAAPVGCLKFAAPNRRDAAPEAKPVAGRGLRP